MKYTGKDKEVDSLFISHQTFLLLYSCTAKASVMFAYNIIYSFITF